MDQLLGLGCACKLVFDKSRGGEIDGPVLSRHPKSPGRSNGIGSKRELPDFLANKRALRPLLADMTAPGWFHYRTLLESGPWPQDDWPYRHIQNKQNDIHIVTDGEPVGSRVRYNVVKKRLDLTNLDGRHRFGLLICQRVYPNPNERWDAVQYPCFGIVIERTIRESQTLLSYDIQIADGAHKGKYADLIDVYAAVWWAYFMATADIDHILRREAEVGAQRPIEINLTAQADRRVAVEFAAEFSLYTRALVAHFHDGPAQSEFSISKLQDHVVSVLGEV